VLPREPINIYLAHGDPAAVPIGKRGYGWSQNSAGRAPVGE